jgi:transcription antitermination factor NusG
MSDWCILRTSGRHTLPLAEALNRGGFEAWTPIAHVRKRLQGTKSRPEIPAPLLPTYVFAKSARVMDLIDLSNAARKDCPNFSLFHYLSRIPLLEDRALDALRVSEARNTRIEKRRQFRQGETVKMTEGGFAGMSGVVEDGDGRFTMVLFGTMRVKISTFLLHPGEQRRAA